MSHQLAAFLSVGERVTWPAAGLRVVSPGRQPVLFTSAGFLTLEQGEEQMGEGTNEWMGFFSEWLAGASRM